MLKRTLHWSAFALACLLATGCRDREQPPPVEPPNDVTPITAVSAR